MTMMRSSLAALFLFTSFAQPSFGCLGEGPKPFTDIGSLTDDGPQPVMTQAEPLEFLFMNRRDALLYRDSRGAVWSQNMATDVPPKQLGTSKFPIAPVLDARERFLVADGESLFQDIVKGTGWLPFRAPFEDSRPLFWNDEYLYNLSSVFSLDGSQRLRVSRYRAGYNFAEEVCPNLAFRPGEGYYVADGQQYPKILLYRAVPKADGKELTVFALDLTTCQISGMMTYNEHVPGDVLGVHWFPAKQIIAVRVNNKERNLLWHRGGVGCEYLNIGPGQMFVPNHDVPMVVTTSEDYGMRFFFPEAGKEGRVGGPFPVAGLRPRDLRSSADGRRMVMLPRNGTYGRQLYRMQLPPVTP